MNNQCLAFLNKPFFSLLTTIEQSNFVENQCFLDGQKLLPICKKSNCHEKIGTDAKRLPLIDGNFDWSFKFYTPPFRNRKEEFQQISATVKSPFLNCPTAQQHHTKVNGDESFKNKRILTPSYQLPLHNDQGNLCEQRFRRKNKGYPRRKAFNK